MENFEILLSAIGGPGWWAAFAGAVSFLLFKSGLLGWIWRLFRQYREDQIAARAYRENSLLLQQQEAATRREVAVTAREQSASDAVAEAAEISRKTAETSQRLYNQLATEVKRLFDQTQRLQLALTQCEARDQARQIEVSGLHVEVAQLKAAAVARDARVELIEARCANCPNRDSSE